MISVTINGKPRTFKSETPLPELLRSLDIDARRVAVAINGEVVSKRQYGETTVRDADVIEIVRMVGGGAATLQVDRAIRREVRSAWRPPPSFVLGGFVHGRTDRPS